MLPLEYKPSLDYMSAYYHALSLYSQLTADAVSIVSEKIWNDKGKEATLVSLARAGTSIECFDQALFTE